MNHTGHNTGNMAFLYSARRMFNASEVVFFSWHVKPKDLSGKVDILFFAAANFLNETSNLTNLANLVKELDVPVILIGLGAQSENKEKIPKLNKGTIDFIQEVSKRTPFIGVRGAFSQKVCEHYGVKNTKILGCPSILINSDRSIGETIENKMKCNIKKVAVHASVIKKHLEKTERELFRIIESFNGNYIVQRPVELMKIINDEALNDKQITYVKRINKLIAPDLRYDEFCFEIKKKGVFFADLESWIHYLKSFTHAIGTRIHGTILPLSAGIPSICITHDTRTIELAEVLKVPHIYYKNFEKMLLSTHEVFESVTFSGEDFEENRTNIANEYKELFSKVGLDLSRKLDKF